MSYSTLQSKDYQDCRQADKSNERFGFKKSMYTSNTCIGRKSPVKTIYKSAGATQHKSRTAIGTLEKEVDKKDSYNYEEKKIFHVGGAEKRPYERQKKFTKTIENKNPQFGCKSSGFTKKSSSPKSSGLSYSSTGFTQKRAYQYGSQNSMKPKDKGIKSSKSSGANMVSAKLAKSKSGPPGGRAARPKPKLQRTGSMNSYQDIKLKKANSKKYSQRRGSNADENDLMTKSRIPVPNAVRKMIKTTENQSSRDNLKTRNPISRPKPNTNRSMIEPERVRQPHYEAHTLQGSIHDDDHLEDQTPSIQDFSTEGLTDDIKDNLVVNLEHLIDEELCINNILENLMKKKPIQKYCSQWWEITENSSVKEMQVFFEEELSRKLIKNHQVLL